MELFSDEYFMREALKQAQMAYDADEVPVGAIVVSNKRVMARTHNLTEKLNDVTAHAEMQAITAAAENLGGKYLNDCTLFVTLEPCPMCAGALRWAQLGRLVFGAADAKRGYTSISAKMLHPKTEITTGIMENEALKLMQDFFQQKR